MLYETDWDVTTRARDININAFTFNDRTGQTPNATVSSNSVTLSGFNDTLRVEVTGNGALIHRSGSYATSHTVTSNNQIFLRMTAPSGFSESDVSTLRVIDPLDNGVLYETTWTVSTVDRQVTPPSFTVNSISGLQPNEQRYSGTVTMTGTNADVRIDVQGDTGRVTRYCCSNAFVTSQVLGPNNQFTFRMQAPPEFSSSRQMDIRVVDPEDESLLYQTTWTLSTVDRDVTPNAFNISDRTGQTPGSNQNMGNFQLAGINAPVNVRISGDPGARITRNSNYTSLTTQLTNLTSGNRIYVRTTASSSYSGSETATIEILDPDTGAVVASDTFTVSTIARDITPSSFNISDRTNQTPGTTQNMGYFTMNGINAPVTVRISGDPSARVTRSSSYSSLVTQLTNVNNGNRVYVRTTANSAYGASETALIEIVDPDTGNVVGSDTFSVTTIVRDVIPSGTFAPSNLTEQIPSRTINRGNFLVSGINDSILYRVNGPGLYLRTSSGSSSNRTTLTRSNGQRVYVYQDTSSAYSTTVTGSITAEDPLNGNIVWTSSDFSLTTYDRDVTPTGTFAPSNLTEQIPSRTINRGNFIVSGINDSVLYRVNGPGLYLRTSTGSSSNRTTLTRSNGQRVYVFQDTSSNFSSSVSGFITAEDPSTGTVTWTSSTFSLTTYARDVTPTAFDVANTSTSSTNNFNAGSFIVNGINDSVRIEVTGDVRVNTSTSLSLRTSLSSITNGRRIYIQFPASSSNQSGTVRVVDPTNGQVMGSDSISLTRN
ncbi:MAG: hypothetical protein Alpg2KO_21510 [Alphaproteobacteria bacterium]